MEEKGGGAGGAAGGEARAQLRRERYKKEGGTSSPRAERKAPLAKEARRWRRGNRDPGLISARGERDGARR